MSPKAARRGIHDGLRERPAGAWRQPRKGTKENPAGAPPKIGTNCFLESTRVGNAAYLVLVGELDISCSERFLASLEAAAMADPEQLVIDLSSITFIDSTGLALLLKANGFARQEGFPLHIVRSSVEIVQAVFEAAGVGKLLPLCDEPPRLAS